MKQGYRVYQEAHVTTADRGRLLLMLYEGAINFLHEAERRMHAGDGVKARQFQGRAFAIISELMNSLNHQAGGEIAANLQRLYSFMLHHLSEGNARQDPKHFRDVARLLSVLNEAFAQAVTQVTRKAAPAARKVAIGAV